MRLLDDRPCFDFFQFTIKSWILVSHLTSPIPKLKTLKSPSSGVSIIPVSFPNFRGISPTRWLLERLRIRRLVRLEIQLGIKPWMELFRKFRIRRVEIWQIKSGNLLVIWLSCMSRYWSMLILVKLLDKLPENLFLPNATTRVRERKLEFHLRIRLKTNQWLQGLNAKKLEISCPKICCLTSPIRRGQLCCWWIQEPFLKNCFHPTWDPRLKSHYQCCLAVLHKNRSETQKEQVILDCQRDQVGENLWNCYLIEWYMALPF